jgi:hypothetical protein
LGISISVEYALIHSREATSRFPRSQSDLSVAHILEGSVRKSCDGSVIFLCAGGPILVELDAGSGEISCPT